MNSVWLHFISLPLRYCHNWGQEDEMPKYPPDLHPPLSELYEKLAVLGAHIRHHEEYNKRVTL